jgi:hypothetical protein
MVNKLVIMIISLSFIITFIQVSMMILLSCFFRPPEKNCLHLENNSKLLSLSLSDPWRGTAFTWPSTALMFVQCIPTVFPVFALLGTVKAIMSLFAFIIFFFTFSTHYFISPMILYMLQFFFLIIFLSTGWSLPATSLFYFLSMTLHGLVWNTIHPAMHGLPDVPLSIGYPSSTLKFLNGKHVDNCCINLSSLI